MIRLRRRTAVTNYRKRIAQLKSGLPRIIVRKSNRGILVQIAAYETNGDKIIASANSKELLEFGWQPRRNIPTAYLTGLLLAKKASKIGDRELTLDIGLYRPVKGSVVFAAAKGTKDGGLKVLANIEIDENRISGRHISNYAGLMKSEAQMKRQFGSYINSKFDIKNMHNIFESTKKSILNVK